MDAVCGAGAGGELGAVGGRERGRFEGEGVEGCFSVSAAEEAEAGTVEKREVGDYGVVAFRDFVAENEVAPCEDLVAFKGLEVGVLEGYAVAVLQSLHSGHWAAYSAPAWSSLQTSGLGICVFAIHLASGSIH